MSGGVVYSEIGVSAKLRIVFPMAGPASLQEQGGFIQGEKMVHNLTILVLN